MSYSSQCGGILEIHVYLVESVGQGGHRSINSDVRAPAVLICWRDIRVTTLNRQLVIHSFQLRWLFQHSIVLVTYKQRLRYWTYLHCTKIIGFTSGKCSSCNVCGPHAYLRMRLQASHTFEATQTNVFSETLMNVTANSFCNKHRYGSLIFMFWTPRDNRTAVRQSSTFLRWAADVKLKRLLTSTWRLYTTHSRILKAHTRCAAAAG